MNELEFYRDIYKSSDIGFDAVTRLMPKVEDKKLRHDMALHMDGYRYFARIAKERLEEAGEKAERENVLKQMPARIGMAMQTMFDTSPAHIAELMIDGSNMSILDLNKKLNRLREQTGNEEVIGVCQNMIDFEETNISRMKRYI